MDEKEILLRRKGGKGNIHAGFSDINADGGVERPSSEENESRWEDGGEDGKREGSRDEPSHPEVGEEFLKKGWGGLDFHVSASLPRPALPVPLGLIKRTGGSAGPQSWGGGGFIISGQ